MRDLPLNKYRAAMDVLQRGHDLLVEGLAEEVLDQQECLLEGGFQLHEFLESQGARLHFLGLIMGHLEQSAETLEEEAMRRHQRIGPESGSDSLPKAIPQSQLKGSQAPPPASAELRRGRGRYSVLMTHLRSHHRPVGIERITCEPVRNKPEAPAKSRMASEGLRATLNCPLLALQAGLAVRPFPHGQQVSVLSLHRAGTAGDRAA